MKSYAMTKEAISVSNRRLYQLRKNCNGSIQNAGIRLLIFIFFDTVFQHLHGDTCHFK
jgi:hypothetical protein